MPATKQRISMMPHLTNTEPTHEAENLRVKTAATKAVGRPRQGALGAKAAISISLPVVLIEAIQKAARTQGISVSAFIAGEIGRKLTTKTI